MNRWAVIPTHNRHDQVTSLVMQLLNEQTRVVVVDNASTPALSLRNWQLAALDSLYVIRNDEQPPNLSRLWNIGLDHIARMTPTGEQSDIAMLNDDAVVPPGWFDYVAGALRADGNAHVACTNAYGINHKPLLKVAPDRDITTRMCPWAFIVRGELGQRADESFRWWWGDTDWDWTARTRGGVLVLPGFQVLNTGANSSTVGELATQAGRDGQYFEQKWGMRPW